MGGCVCRRRIIKCNQTKPTTRVTKTNPLYYKDQRILRKSSSNSISIHISNLQSSDNTTIKENYEIGSILGQGVYGTVYQVTHRKTKQICAMKVLSKSHIGFDKQSQSLPMTDSNFLIKEVDILKRTDHPNIIKIYEYYQDAKRYYIITEYIPNSGELYDIITKYDTFNEDTAADIIYQIVSAVNHLHSMNIVHRDIKPENIIITNQGKDKDNYKDNYKNKNKDKNKDINEIQWDIKLIDFGTGGFMINDTLSNCVGTPYYRAPEIMKGKYNEKVDIWSCGVILYMLLSGCPPFNGKDNAELKQAIRKAECTFPKDDWYTISTEAKSLVKSMLQKNPSLRPSAKQVLEHPFLMQVMNKKKRKASHQITQVLSSLQNFNAKNKLYQATLAYIVHYVISNEEIQDLKTVFQVLDISKTGTITNEELRQGFEQVYGKEISHEEIKAIMAQIDQNNNGVIEYEEFLRATLNWKSLLSEDNLRNAFGKFDSNKDGKLSKCELITLFKVDLDSKCDNEVGHFIDELILKVNEDGQSNDIDYNKFRDMMYKTVNGDSNGDEKLLSVININNEPNITNNNDTSMNMYEDNSFDNKHKKPSDADKKE